MDLRELATTTHLGVPLLLSPPAPADADAIYELVQDPSIPRWTTVPSPYPREFADDFVASTAATWEAATTAPPSAAVAGPELVWAMRVGGRFAGCAGLKRHGGGTLEIGWWLGVPYRGQGIVTAATALLVTTAFSPDYPLQATTVTWHAYLGNQPSARIAHRLGFRYTGLFTDPDAGPCWSAELHPGDPLTPSTPWTAPGEPLAA
ncbi:MAG: GNAT family N-acetyltransferase [Propionibacteriaceae bacterium]|jgi:RimJ/RimL family protein N-acetyltransferase|nr:GNAT family N-acetyltransferase [Propionibacteriaceae bacterium]